MAIVAAELPPRARDAMREGLVASARFPGRRRAKVSLSVPHLVFAAGLEALAGGGRLRETAEAVAWRALVEEDEHVVAAGEVTLNGDTPAAITRGAPVQSTVDALLTAEREERIASAAFGVRLLPVALLCRS